MIQKLNRIQRIHFVGVGGIGMSALAEILMSQGYIISGSDKNYNENIKKLESKGMIFVRGHHSETVAHAQLVVISSAINRENPEYNYALDHGIPVMKRGKLLADMMLYKKSLCVSGTHGKTTTTSMLATILVENNFDPTILVGGNVANLGGNARVGKSDYFVSEVDESDGSFLWLSPTLSIVTNIDSDHLDYYGNFDSLKKAFVEFINKTPFYGISAINLDDSILCAELDKIKVPICTFAINHEADFQAKNIKHSLTQSTFELYHLGKNQGMFEINLPGEHNVLNSLGAIALAFQLGLSFREIAFALKSFIGVGRRLEPIKLIGKMQVIDDYAHHPTEIKTTISTIRKMTNKKIIVAFEPHRFTRTQKCWPEFLTCFDSAHKVYMLPIYAASEKEIPGINSAELINQIQINSDVDIEEADSLDVLYHLLVKHKEEDCLFVTLGAGPISAKIREICKSF